ncbi:hypothetical protein [Actinomadura macra]|uniref:hypothetical protein n=1 Tax=Actinomadura macra TaxID=46164 RepID=UPI000A7CA79E|nr:hypothetical protein [Actinomadura macra]
MRRTLGHVSLTVATVAAAVVLPSSLASAAPKSISSLEKCPPRSLCGWSGPEFTGKMTTFGVGAGCLNPPFPLRSVANTYGGARGIPIVLGVLTGKDCSGGDLGSVSSGQSLPTLREEGLSVWSVW